MNYDYLTGTLMKVLIVKVDSRTFCIMGIQVFTLIIFSRNLNEPRRKGETEEIREEESYEKLF